MSPQPSNVDYAEVQKLVVCDYKEELCRHFVLRVKDPDRAQTFLANLVNGGWITYAKDGGVSVAKSGEAKCGPVNIAFTFRGLQALELDLPYMNVFRDKAKAFVEGAYARSAQRLADTGPSAAVLWEKRFEADRAHVLLSIYADAGAGVGNCAEEILDNCARPILGIDGFNGFDNSESDCVQAEGENGVDFDNGAQLIDDPVPGQSGDEKMVVVKRVHFGYRDGIAQPRIKGYSTQGNSEDFHAAGEFLLGYENDDAFNPWLLPLVPDPPDVPKDLARFFRNGSFAAYRKMKQDEERFRDYVKSAATKLGNGRQLEWWQEYVMAKMCGRWRDGNVVTPNDRSLPPEPVRGSTRPRSADDLNKFDFSQDENGLGCPFGAHIRRMNPRTDPVVPLKSRPLIRRSVPYGPRYNPEKVKDKDLQRGLLGLFICASLEDQFELLLAEWGDMNPMGPKNRGNSKDPLIGNHENPNAFLYVPLPGESTPTSSGVGAECGKVKRGEKMIRLTGFSPFVTTRGTLYAFYPSRYALRKIAKMDQPSK